MAETALCQYHCPNCKAELEQEGYIIIEATDPQVNSVLDLSVNKVICPECAFEHTLTIPLFYLDSQRELLACYMPGAGQMDGVELANAIRIPYERLMMIMSERLGIELPEPDAAAFPPESAHNYTPFSALTEAQAAELYPAYLLRPLVVDGMEVVSAVAQAVLDGMKAEEVMDDMSRLQLINGVLNAPDPIARRKVLHRYEPMLNAEMYEVIDTLREQMTAEGNDEMVKSLTFVRGEIERYKASQQARRQKQQSAAKKFEDEAEEDETE